MWTAIKPTPVLVLLDMTVGDLCCYSNISLKYICAAISFHFTLFHIFKSIFMLRAVTNFTKKNLM